MKTILFSVLITIVCFGCQDDMEIDDQPMMFYFNGTINNQEFNFIDNSLILGMGSSSTTNATTYEQRSSFGNPIPTQNDKGIRFLFLFYEKPNYDLIKSLDGESLLNYSETQPILRMTVFDSGNIYESEFGAETDDTFEIESVTITVGEEETFNGFTTGDVIALKGKMSLNTEDVNIQGEFILKLVEIE